MENGPFEDVFQIGHGDIPASYVSLPEGNHPYHPLAPSTDKDPMASFDVDIG